MKEEDIEDIPTPDFDGVEPANLDPLQLIALSLAKLNHTVARSGGLPVMAISTDLASDAIPLQCSGQYDAIASGDGEETEFDLPGGAGPAAVRAAAAASARTEARQAALDALDALGDRIECEQGCTVQAQGNPVVTMGRVAIAKTSTGYFDMYTATVTATAKQTFKCV